MVNKEFVFTILTLTVLLIGGYSIINESELLDVIFYIGVVMTISGLILVADWSRKAEAQQKERVINSVE